MNNLQGISRYIRRRQLDPLETYVPAVLEARGQLLEAGQIMGEDAVQARLLLRQNAFTGLRDSIKALGQYAGKSTLTPTAANALVSDFFAAVEAYDFLLFDAVRDGQPVPASAGAVLQNTLDALDRLVATVPQPIVEKSRRVVEAAMQPQQDGPERGGRPMDNIRDLIPSI